MKKLTKEINISTTHAFECNVIIDEFIYWLGEQKKLGATHIDILNGDYSSVYIESYYIKEESDEEYNERVNNQIESKRQFDELMERSEREEYERLRLKYGMGFGY